MGIFFLIIFSQFSIDIAGFNVQDSFCRCEIYTSMPYSELSYQREENLFKSAFKIRLNLSGDKKVTKEWNKTSYISSYQSAKKRNLHILDQINLLLKPGKYNLKIEIVSDSNTNSVQKLFKIESSPKGLYLSDIQLATKIECTDSLGKFIKNGLRIIPNPQCIFGRRYSVLYAYSEIYNLNPENNYEVSYSILNESDELVQKLSPKILPASSKNVTEVAEINVKNFEEGNYLLKIEVLQGEITASKEKNFSVAKRIAKEEFTAEELKYYNLIKYIASSKELEFYNNLADEVKHNFLVNFWGKAGKELLHNLMERVKYSDDTFATIGELGRDSDRGRIWIRYGKPDEIEQYPYEVEYNSCEKWIYFRQGGIAFIFVDKAEDGRYELMYSSIPKEPTNPNYDKWVNPEILE